MNERTAHPPDCISEILADLRQARPSSVDVDRWNSWLASVGHFISAIPTVEQRWAYCTLLADDLAKATPGLPLCMAYGTIAGAVFVANGMKGRR